MSKVDIPVSVELDDWKKSGNLYMMEKVGRAKIGEHKFTVYMGIGGLAVIVELDDATTRAFANLQPLVEEMAKALVPKPTETIESQ
jgi:hypothetical protein